MSDLATTLRTLAGELAIVSPSHATRLRELALDVARLERFHDEVVRDAIEDDALVRGGGNVVSIRSWS